MKRWVEEWVLGAHHHQLINDDTHLQRCHQKLSENYWLEYTLHAFRELQQLHVILHVDAKFPLQERFGFVECICLDEILQSLEMTTQICGERNEETIHRCCMHHYHYGDEYGVYIGDLIARRRLEIEGKPRKGVEKNVYCNRLLMTWKI